MRCEFSNVDLAVNRIYLALIVGIRSAKTIHEKCLIRKQCFKNKNRSMKHITPLYIQIYQVVPSGGVSNFLKEDFDALLKFMNAEMQKKKLSFK
jgi:hypothetical protein